MELFKYMKVGQAAGTPRHQSDNIQCDQSVVTEPGGSFAEGSGERYPYSIQKACGAILQEGVSPAGKQRSRAPAPENILDMCNVVNEFLPVFPYARQVKCPFMSFVTVQVKNVPMNYAARYKDALVPCRFSNNSLRPLPPSEYK